MLKRSIEKAFVGAAILAASGCVAESAREGEELAYASDGVGEEGDEDSADSIGETSQALVSPTFGYIAAEELGGVTPAQALAQMPKLKGTGIGMVQDWKATKLDDPARWAVVAKGKTDGTPVFPWLVLAPGAKCDLGNPAKPCDLGATKPANYAQTGYYPNATNYAEWISKALALMDLWKTKGYAPTTFVVDFEMRDTSWAQFGALGGKLVADTINLRTGLGQFMQAEINRPRYGLALAAFKTFVDKAHAKGWKVHMTTVIHCLDDYLDGDDTLRQAFNVPLNDQPLAAGSIAWDEVSFQAYRTVYETSTGLPGSPYFVYSYGSTARTYFGVKASLDIGLAEQYDATKLRRDVWAATAIGIPASKLAVYSLKGIIDAPTQDWFGAPLFTLLVPDLLTPALVAFDVALDTVVR